jgi:glutamyl-tRNA reductase
MELLVFGLNHRTAPLEVRERWALSRAESLAALARLREQVSPSEHVILSTCNRTEFYSHVPRARSPIGSGDDPAVHRRNLARFYLDGRGRAGAAYEDFDPEHFYLHRQHAAVEHLFRVAGGLDSMIVGESEILHQIKDAFDVAREGQAAGRMFQRLFPEAIKVGKLVRTLTDITKGCITPGQAALRLAEEVLGDVSRARALLVGSGKIGAIAARSLIERGLRDFAVVNRTAPRARALIDELLGRAGEGEAAGATARALPWDELPRALEAADLVISSTGSTRPIISRALLEEVQARRGGRPLVLIDLAIPRDVEASAPEVAGVRLFNIDDLNRVIQDNIAKRHEHVAKAEGIVRAQLQAFFGRLNYLKVDPVIKHLVERFEDIRLGELQAALDRFPPEYHPAVDDVTRRLVGKLIHFPIERLKSVRDMEGLGEAEIKFLKRLFLPES